MQLSILLAMLLEALFIGDSFATSLGRPTDGCWVHQIPVRDGKENVSTVCIKDLDVTLSMHFANPGSKPTTCRQVGAIALGDGAAFSINLNLGYCENGHGIAPDPMHCVRDGVESITCKIDGAKDAWVYFKAKQ